MRKLALLCFMILAAVLVHSQVGINTKTPFKLSELDIQNLKNSGGSIDEYKGILIPRMTEAERDLILAYSGVTPQDSIEANSLLIFNTTEGCYNFFQANQRRWKSLCGGYDQAVFDVANCDSISVLGSYIVGREMTSSNRMKLMVEVTTPGSYEIIATTDNGYNFMSSGTFLSAGKFTVYAYGQGAPVNENNSPGDIVAIYFNGDQHSCTKIIPVYGNIANYTMDCSNIVVNGVYSVGKQLTNSNSITLTVNVKEAGSWSASTDLVNGISFSGYGEFTTVSTNQTITIYGAGTPSVSVPMTLTITTHSKGGTATVCTTTISPVIKKKRVVSFGNDNYYPTNNNNPGRLITNPNNFGLLDNSIFKAEAVSFESYSGNQTAATVQSITTGTNPCDILIMTYNSDIVNTTYAGYLKTYVENGGVLLLFSEHLTTSSAQGLYFFQQLFNAPYIQSTDDDLPAGGGYVYKLPNIDDPIINGPFGDLRGKYVGDDFGYTDTFSNLPAEELEWSIYPYDYGGSGQGNRLRTVMFKAKNYNIFFYGDGGGLNGDNVGGRDIHPLVTTTTALGMVPSTKSYGTGSTPQIVENATFWCNLMAWALQAAEANGINSK